MTSNSNHDGGVDILRWPVLGLLLKFRHARTLFQIPVLLISILMILHGLFGPTLSPKNLATSLTWVFFRGVLVLVLLMAGNFFCMACPFILVRDLARKLHAPRLNWPRRLRNKWLSTGLFAAVLFVYEAFSLWASPFWTALLIIGYFAAIVVVDVSFKHATFCKFICPIGQFNFIASTLSPLEIQVRSHGVCDTCRTKDCIRGRRAPANELVTIQRGCELALFQPQKVGNMDCTFCLDCVHACPHDNIGITSRVPGDELQINPRRSGVGYLLNRPDVAALAALFTFGALMNAFGMVSAVYALERWLSQILHTGSSLIVLGVVFLLVTVVAPLLLLNFAAVLAKRWAHLCESVLRITTRYSFALTPVGFGLWLAHYGFHLLTGLYTVIPITQNALLAALGWPILGDPRWTLIGLPLHIVKPVQYGLLSLGALGSFALAQHYAEEDCGRKWIQAFVPWAAVVVLIACTGAWLITQPMDMRATFLE